MITSERKREKEREREKDTCHSLSHDVFVSKNENEYEIVRRIDTKRD